MYEPPTPDDLDPHKHNDAASEAPSKSITERAQSENLSTQNVLQHENKLKTLFLWLIGIGLGLGIILAIGVGIAMKKFGLTDKPYEREDRSVREQIQHNVARIPPLQ